MTMDAIEIGIYEIVRPIGERRIRHDDYRRRPLQVMVAWFAAALVNCGAALVFIFGDSLNLSHLSTRTPAPAAEATTIEAFLVESPTEVVQPSAHTHPLTALPRSSGQPDSLQGIYRRQIASRLARALEDAKVSLSHSCQCRIKQTRAGAIVDIRLGPCAADQVLRKRLEAAIRQGAPLPAPPATSVFTATLLVDIGKDVRVVF